ncbi:pectinesterase family protein [Streptomyces sp. NPDC002156]
MTSAEQGRPSRRSFLAAATAVSAMAVGGLGLVVAAAPSASATPTANLTWTISSEPEVAKMDYARLLNGIRRLVSDDNPQRTTTGRPVLVTDEDGDNEFIAVDLEAEDRPELIRLFIRRSDAYIMGWRSATRDGDVAYLSTFFTLDPHVQLPGSIRPGNGVTNANTNTRFENLANYSDLQQQGATRDGMQISPSSLHNAVLTLQGGAQATTRNAAAAILQIIVGIAEASRFRHQAAETATAFGNGLPFTVTARHIEHHNNWSLWSGVLLGAMVAGAVALTPEIEAIGATYQTVVALAAVIMLAHHGGKHTKRGGKKIEGAWLLVAPDGTGDYWTVQDAIDYVPYFDQPYTIFIDEGTYHEFINIPAGKPWMMLEGVSANAADVVITGDRAHGMLKPDGTQWGTQGSAVATFKSIDLRVSNLTIANSFDPAAHPEINPYETQAVALAAMGDRQVYNNVRIIGRQDTVLVKSPVVTDQTRQYFVNSYIEGSIDFIFGNATAVFDRCRIAMRNWVGGTVLAPNTDWRQKYGILITGSEIFTNGVPDNTMYLGRPWHNVQEAWPQAVIRGTKIHSGIRSDHPWTDMVPEYPWSWARFKEYSNSSVYCVDQVCSTSSAPGGSNRPMLTDSEAADYTAQKYLAGSDGWNPVL